MQGRSLRLASVVAVCAAAALAAQEARADYTTKINPAATHGTWEGWGTSLAWWANTFGNRSDFADLMFTLNTTSYGGQNLPGLGLNIARYNAGASTWTPIGSLAMVASPNISAFKQIPGYWLNWYSLDPTSASWDWSADANQRNMLQMAKARGANKLELFSNSPIWWMTYNGNPSGASDGSENLESWNQQGHAQYLATVALYAHNNWGIDFTSVEALNEPSASWWTATGTQEGCHINVSTQANVVNYLRSELNNRGLSWMMVSASDENTYDQATSTWNNLGSTAHGNVGRINTHGYQYGNGRRDLLYAAAHNAGKGLWNSEYGDGDSSGMSLASNLNLDLRWLYPTAWVYWQPFDYGGWGFIQADGSNGWLGPVNPKYFVAAQFTRHIRPGMTMIDGGESNTVAAYDGTAHKLIIVTTNYGTAQWINYDLSKFSSVSGASGGLVYRWATNTGGGDSYTARSDTYLSGQQFWSYFQTNTVQTFEVDNVNL